MAENPIEISGEEIQELEGMIDGIGGSPTLGVSEGRLKSPQKMRYSAEVEIIKKKWGDLEDIRKTLGISQRKMSQLLMVDPSAWTRWTKYKQDPPAHIYRALSWFLLLQEKDPTLANPFLWLQSVARPRIPKSEVQAMGLEIKDGILLEYQEQLESSHRRMKWLLILNFSLLTLLVLVVTLYLLVATNTP